MTDDTQDGILKRLLVALLREAAEMEHQLMIQYLYAAFSLKKYPDRTCNEAQYEFVRRWGSTLLMVARQEMEHLALVNGMLSAIGAEPFFDRRNIPRQLVYFLGKNLAAGRDQSGGTEPCDLPFVFERFNLATIQRFVCFESPSLETLETSGSPIPKWCFSCGDQPYPRSSREERAAGTVRRAPHLYDLAESRVPDELWEQARGELAQTQQTRGLLASAGTDELKPGTLQELYDLIELLFDLLDNGGSLFTGNPSSQVFVPVEYQINIFPITDLSTAKSAIRLIVEEGEGIDAPPDFQSHFLRFFRMHDELAELLERDPRFEPSLPLLLNPQRDEITNPFAREVFDLFNYTYATLLFLLTALYRDFEPVANQSYPFFSSALQENAFGPMMTMMVRPMAEVLAYTASGDGEHTTGPNYYLSETERELLRTPGSAQLGNIEFFLCRFDEIARRLAVLGDADLAMAAREESDVPFLRRQLAFVHESAVAMANNLRRIYQIGQLPQFIVSP